MKSSTLISGVSGAVLTLLFAAGEAAAAEPTVTTGLSGSPKKIVSKKERMPKTKRRAPSHQAEQRSLSLRERATFYEPYIAASALRHHVDPRLLWTIAFLETRFRPELVSPKGARGMMQFMPATARYYKLGDPHNAAAAIDAAASLVRDLDKRFGGNVAQMLAGYNAGEAAVEAFRDGQRIVLSSGKVINPAGLRTTLGIPPYRETRNYVTRGNLVLRAVAHAAVFSPSLIARTGHSPTQAPPSPINYPSALVLIARPQGRHSLSPVLSAPLVKVHPSQVTTRNLLSEAVTNSLSTPQAKPLTRSIFYASSTKATVRVTGREMPPAKMVNPLPEARAEGATRSGEAPPRDEVFSIKPEPRLEDFEQALTRATVKFFTPGQDPKESFAGSSYAVKLPAAMPTVTRSIYFRESRHKLRD